MFRNPGLGAGVLAHGTYTAAQIRLPSPDLIKCDVDKFDGFLNREIKTIFEELGLPRAGRDCGNIDPSEVSLQTICSDRRELDEIVFTVLGLTGQEQLEVYRAVAQLARDRLARAASTK
ncbi:unnamed protein product [marine sediment metagenome]|uniref:Uncharacterized protein n=1 Tax=marine sediment metagenome TaxID=412755 RepID=X1J7J4_9ZZZZ